MNYCYLILMGQFVLMEVTKVYGNPPGGDLPIPDEIRIVLRNLPERQLHLYLVLANSVLANANLPVWIMEGKVDGQCVERNGGPKLNLETKVMENVGEFAFYQDPKSTTAAVYFHKRQQFDGMIDSRFIIQGLSMDRINTRSKSIIQVGKSGINRRSHSMEHSLPTIDLDNHSVPGEQHEIIKTYKNRVYNGYPELLVVVSHELAKEILKNREKSDDYATIVSYVLTLFNGVDMLYSKLKETKIQFNIAGVIISSECETSTLTKGCYDQATLSGTNEPINIVYTTCIAEKLENYFFNQMNVFTIGSYDIVIYLALDQLIFKTDKEYNQVEGFAIPRPIYKSMKERKVPILVAAVRDDSFFRSYSTAAHELAHLMYVLHDDGALTRGQQCYGTIMKSSGSTWCKNCLSWSSKSEKAFKQFFSSADCIGFTGSPESLLPRGRREILTADEQCQRFGFKSTTVYMDFSKTYCQTKLQCLDEMGGIHDTVYPFLGTRCDHDKVCWRMLCLPIQNFPN